MNHDAAARRRVHTWSAPWNPADSESASSGLEFLRAMLDGTIPEPPICSTLGFRMTAAEEGRTVFEGEPAEFHYNPFGSVHGGFYAAILDSAFGTAVLLTLGPGAGFTTLEFKINLVRPMYADTGTVRAEAWIVHQGSRMATAEGRLVDASGKLYAHGNSTCMVFDSWGQRERDRGGGRPA